jgi:hypothetical protein
MQFLELFDETLDINSTENYQLSVQVSYDGLAYSLLDNIRNKFVLIRTFVPEESKYFNVKEINDLIIKDDFLTRQYKRVRVITPCQKFTLVPAPLFDPGKKEAYFTFNHLKEDHEVIISNKVSDPDAYLLFSLSEPVSDLIKIYYPEVHPLHHIKPLLYQISHKRNSVHGNYIHIHIERDFFNLVISNNNTLKFCNTYNYRNVSDILYFVLNVFRNLDIKQEETIYFSGLTEKYDDLSSNFSLYIRNIRFAEPAGNFSFSYVFNDMELHRYLNIFNVVNCE